MSIPARSARLATVWLGPAVAIVLIGGAGQLFGILGAILTTGAACATLFFSVAEASDVLTRRRAALLALVVLLLVMATFAWQGALSWSAGLSPAPGDQIDRHGSRITPADVRQLRGALIAGADLKGLDLRGQSLAGAYGPGATFANADLSHASLRGADLRGADLRGACLVGTDLAGADLTGAYVEGTQVSLPPGVTVVGTPLPIGHSATSCH
jgi:hypothetical protein